MAGPRAARLQVGSAPWIAEERSSALQIVQDEIEEFSFSARNDFEWLNEHMAEVFSENQINVAEIFKTPGKLRGKTPRTIRKANPAETRVPLSNIFSATPKGGANPFAIPNIDRNQTPRVKIAVDPQPQASPERISRPQSPQRNPNVVSVVDSGYHGSQSQEAMDFDDCEPTQENVLADHVTFDVSSPVREAQQNADPAATVGDDMSTQFFTANVAKFASPATQTLHHESTTPAGSPAYPPLTGSPQKTSPIKSSPMKPSEEEKPEVEQNAQPEMTEAGLDEGSRSPSDGSSPIRPIVRKKSSLNFASLPAREPITHKSIGNRVSRTSHLDQKRSSYYNRPTGGKSLGNTRHEATDDENDDMDIDDEVNTVGKETEQDDATTHNKTYTQRLQDQISRLGQTQPNASRPSKSTTNAPVPAASVPSSRAPPTPKTKSSPKIHSTPGAFPEDDEEDEDDDWIQPLGPPDNASNFFSPRPGIAKSYTADVMEGVFGNNTVGGSDFAVPKTRQNDSGLKSPQRHGIPDKTASTPSHQKSASVPSLPTLDKLSNDGGAHKKTVSVSNPSLATVSENEAETPGTSSKSPSRTFRDSPLKQVKSKLSSILKTSKGLLASSAALSAEGKSSLLSPSTPRLGFHPGFSTMTVNRVSSEDPQPLYPDLSRHVMDTQAQSGAVSPTRPEGRRTRASIEREKAEEKRKEKEAKEARRKAEQMQKLEQARKKEQEKARAFSEEQKRIMAMEKQIAAQKEQEKKTPAAVQTPGNPSKPTRTSPRKGKAQLEAEARAAAESKPEGDVEMSDAPGMMPPPSVPRSAAPASSARREIKRPTKPTKELAGKTKQGPPMQIKVNTGSYYPSNSTLASNLHDTLGPANTQYQLKGKSSQATLQAKPSLQSLKSSQSSSGRPRALELAARKKEQEEREAQRKRDLKAEMERKREEKSEMDRREERQKEDARKNAQRQAMLEKAKQTKAPPPALRSQNGQPEYRTAQQNDAHPPRPPTRMNLAARSQEDLGRTALPSATKPGTKRTIPQDPKGAKKMRMSDDFDDDIETESQPGLKGLPVRPPSSQFKKVAAGTMQPLGQKNAKPQDLANKFPVGYAPAPPSATRSEFYKPVTSQHNSQHKPNHPLAMTQVSKDDIPFRTNSNQAGPSHKTPGRPGGIPTVKSVAKSATRSSPRFQNGESIELPEINTDDEDEYDDEEQKEMFASWTDSPALRAALVAQERQDPMQVFGVPGPINMEEVFSKSNDRFHKFRARTSSANWSGADRLTEDDIRKDLAAREKLRREGGWTYEMSKEVL